MTYVGEDLILYMVDLGELRVCQKDRIPRHLAGVHIVGTVNTMARLVARFGFEPVKDHFHAVGIQKHKDALDSLPAVGIFGGPWPVIAPPAYRFGSPKPQPHRRNSEQVSAAQRTGGSSISTS